MMVFLNKIRLLWRIFLHKDAPWSVKLLLLAGFFYLIFPMDILPDQILLAGWLDDLALAVIMYIIAMKLTPEDLIKKLVAGLRPQGRKKDGQQ
jgi:uncharacterized membrane protein YkvA (DUF1232 family)